MNRNSSPDAMEVMVTPTTQNIDLDQLIVERKQDKQKTLKEKLQRHVRIIRDRRKCRANSESFPKGAFKRLMNNAIWEEIVEYLRDSSDVTSSAFFTCRPLGGILKEQRLLMWLPKALNIFKEKIDEAYDFKGDEMGKATYQNWNAICSYARLACKSWKKTIDIHAKTARFNWVVTLDHNEENLDDLRTNVFTFDREEESVDTATSLVLKHGLPFRDVCVDIHDDTTEHHFSKLLEYFKVHGGSVRFLRFEYCIYRTIGSGACERLFHVLKYVENLKKLDLVFYDGDHDDDDDDDDEMMELEEEDQDIPEGFYQYPLPALDSLEHFTCGNWSNKESFVAQILRRCVNLRSGVLYGNDGEIFEDTTYEALMGLRLERFSSFSTPFWFMSHQVTWPLKHLGISQSCGLGVIASLLVPAINRFRHTLEHLEIYSAVKMDADARNVLFELPHLKSFSIHVIRPGTLGLDDLLPLKSLEKITVDTVEYEDENVLVKMKEYLESGEMYKSNVWQCLLKLVRFEKDDVGGRRCYFRPTLP